MGTLSLVSKTSQNGAFIFPSYQFVEKLNLHLSLLVWLFERHGSRTISEAYSEWADERMSMEQHRLSGRLSFSNQGVRPGGHARRSRVWNVQNTTSCFSKWRGQRDRSSPATVPSEVGLLESNDRIYQLSFLSRCCNRTPHNKSFYQRTLQILIFPESTHIGELRDSNFAFIRGS